MNNTKTLIFAALAAATLAACSNGSGTACKTPAIAHDRDIEAKVEKTLKGMTLREKAGQRWSR